MWELRDEFTNKVIFVGTMEECLKYSREHPSIRFILTEVKQGDQR